MVLTIDVAFELGQTVYLKTDKEQLPRIVTRYWVSKSAVLYALGCGTGETTHFDLEISDSVDVLTKIDG